MKRDMDLVRKILFQLEERSDEQQSDPMSFAGCSTEDIHYHIKIMYQAGLIEVIGGATDLYSWVPLGLTWAGHDFLDAAREQTRWDKAKHLVKDKAGTVSFDVFKQLLINLSLKAVGL